ncbi:MAG TPA: alcohol dehydrogenase-like regulatory protein ErcA [Rhodocyclaceae bacterium]
MSLYEQRKFVAPEFIFGLGARHRAGQYARNYGARRVLVVTDSGVVAAGWLPDVIKALEDAGLPFEVFRGVTPNPRDGEVRAGVEVYLARNCNVIVALGGGSVIDCAKGIGIMATNPGDILAYEGVDKIEHPAPPLICIPTTAGTSADVSQFCIINDLARRVKIAIISKAAVPDVALVDPETTRTMDTYLTACTGIDALVHAIEAFVSTASSPVVDVHAMAAARLIRDNLRATLENPEDLVRREQMMLASLHAGLAFSNASLGAVHATAHSLGGFLDRPHGESNALMLEHVIRFNYPHAAARYDAMAEALGVEMGGLRGDQRRDAFIAWVRDLRLTCGIDAGLEARGVRAADVSDLAHFAAHDPCIFTNPRRATQADIRVIYEEAL